MDQGTDAPPDTWITRDGEQHLVTGWTRTTDDDPTAVTACGHSFPFVDDDPDGDTTVCRRCAP